MNALIKRMLYLTLPPLTLSLPAEAAEEPWVRYTEGHVARFIDAQHDRPPPGQRTPLPPLPATASGWNAVAVGPGSHAPRANTVAFGNRHMQRRLTQLAPGSEASDAVTLGQMQQHGAVAAERVQAMLDDARVAGERRLDRRIDGMENALKQGIAMSAALAALRPNPAGGPNHLALGAGGFAGRQALALGYFRQMGRNAMLNAGVAAVGSNGPLASSLGASLSW